MLKVDDRHLWGNEAADDEDPELLNSYFVTQPEWNEFLELQAPLSIARARKGMGKSALLRECGYRVTRSGSQLVISIKGSDLVAQKDFRFQTATEHIYDWQQRICAVINRQIGATIGLALSDTSITLVEAAELSGFKSRNLVGTLLDRLKGKLGQVEFQKLEIRDNKALLQRHLLDKEPQVCILIDDIDATFNASKEECLRLSTFFSACRELAANFKGVAIRTAIRSDVWATIRKTDEALDKVEQYILDISWSQKEFRAFLAERIGAYCHRIKRSDLVKDKSKDQIVQLVFETHFPWGRGSAPPHRVIHIYAGGRPRWAAQLCRMAGKEALRVGSPVIKFGHIKQVLEDYGRFRLDDVSREHRHQCEVVSDIVNAFGKQSTTFSTRELQNFVQKRILANMKVHIDGHEVSDSIQIARFLFRIGFVLGVSRDDVNPDYYSFEEKPDLLKNHANLDDGMKWHIHPSFHTALSLSHLGDNARAG